MNTRNANKLLRSDKRFNVADALQVIDPICFSRQLDTTDRFHHPFFWEICPLVTISEYLDEPGLEIRFTAEGARFDGELIFKDREEPVRVELTAAIDGQQENLRVELRKERGHAPAFNWIRATGTKNCRQFAERQHSMFSRPAMLQQELLPRMKKALDLKVKKGMDNAEYAGAWLGVVFDDSIVWQADMKKSELDPICRQLLDRTPEGYQPFERVFCVGVSRGYIFDSVTLEGALLNVDRLRRWMSA